MRLPLKHFKPEEFHCSCGCDKDYAYMKESILTLVDEIRDKFGQPIIVTSSIRCAKHNKKIGGVPNSYHTQGLACDIAPLKKSTTRNYAVSVRN
jgi:Peptidase M15.